ncbi:alpha/beta hydrolase [Sphingomonas crusticola]|uniref:alpha/beta hydrolase n=1 Tax=Sphingomonas crusticola TaxID=1697973 RepID=UPI0019682DCF|nr:alpha/beta fold hydrolase [Sphingomonas crusticola]
MRKLFGIAAGLLLSSASWAEAADRDVSIDGGKAPLHGSLMTPAAARPGPAVLLISGSGPTDRNGNSAISAVRPANMRLLAEGLAAHGLVSLRYDKRGVADSAAAVGAEADLRFATYVDDAEAWVHFLEKQPGVSCVVLAGHSEGALIATMAAERTKICGLVLLSGAGRPARAVIAEQLGKVPEPTRTAALAALDQLAAGKLVADPPIPALFRPSVQPYMISWLAIDPAAELHKAAVPVTIIQGLNDLQVSADDARALASARPTASLLMLDGVNHVLKPAPADPAANFATYADPNLPLDPRIVPAIVDLVKRARR